MAKLTKIQKNMLKHIDSLPSQYRHQQTPSKKGGWLKREHLEIYDKRSLRGLFEKGYLEESEFGVRLKKTKLIF